MNAKEQLSEYLRRVFIIEDGNGPWVVAKKAYDGSIAAVWKEGGFVPPHIYYRYLDVVPGAREDFIEAFHQPMHYELPSH